MILVKLMGGLGNQMFQYAAGRCLAEKHQTCLKLDTSFLQKKEIHHNHTQRDFALDVFAISSSLASKMEIKRFTASPGSFIKRVARLFNRNRQTNYLKERHFHYQPDFMNAPDNTYLDGFWQSEKYFTAIAPILRKEFRFIPALEGLNLDLETRIRNCNAVAIHVRRGDYVSNPETNMYHGTCSIDFYHLAVLAIAKRVYKPEFFIFSDDITWVKSNFKLNYPLNYVQNNSGDKSFIDMQLMSLCKHQIIANSSFSWWAAWLNTNTEKVVVTPKKWFTRSDLITSDLLPQSWISI